MQAYDIVILVLLAASAIWGARRGFAKQFASLASLIVGYIAAVQFRQPVATLIDATPPWNVFVAMLILFMGTSLAIWIAFRFVQDSIEKMGLQGFNHQMGGLFGLAKGVVLAMILTMFVVAMMGDRPRASVLRSYSGNTICHALTYARAVVPSEWQETVGPYLNVVEEQHQLVEQPSGLLIPGDVSDLELDLSPAPRDERAPVSAPTGFNGNERIRPNRSADQFGLAETANTTQWDSSSRR